MKLTFENKYHMLEIHAMPMVCHVKFAQETVIMMQIVQALFGALKDQGEMALRTFQGVFGAKDLIQLGWIMMTFVSNQFPS